MHQAADDGGSPGEETIKSIEHTDKRIGRVVVTMVSPGIRVKAGMTRADNLLLQSIYVLT